MANDLVSYTALVQGLLEADTNRFPQATVTAALRQAIDDYSRLVPILEYATIAAVLDQQNYNLTTLTNLIHPYDVLDNNGDPLAFFYYRLNGSTPYIFIFPSVPAVGNIIIRYTKLQTLKDLDSAATTTIRTDHTNLIVAGAVGFALQVRLSGRLEADNLDPATLENYRDLSNKYLTKFYEHLSNMLLTTGPSGFKKS